MEPIIRNLLRVGAGIMMARGFDGAEAASQAASDPELHAILASGLEAIIGGITWVCTEIWYAIAKRTGRRT